MEIKKCEICENYMPRVFDLYAFQSESINGVYQLKKDRKIEKIIDYLNSCEFKYNDAKKITKQTVKNINKEFFNEYFNLQEIYTIRNDEFKKISPLEIRIKSINEDNFGEIKTKIDYKEHPKVYKYIGLSKNCNLNSIGIYAHEITHTQLEESIRINLTNYFNREMLSIFLEKVIMYENKIEGLDNIENMRRHFLKNALYLYDENTWKTFKDRCNYRSRSYIVSTLEADHLFYIYLNSSRRVQLNILKKINDIFKRENSVENLLQSYKVTYGNSKKLEYIKKY